MFDPRGTMTDNVRISTCPGLDAAIIGTTLTNMGTTVPVYSIERIIDLFRGDRMAAMDWVTGIEARWDPSIMPVFMNEAPHMPAMAVQQRGLLN